MFTNTIFLIQFFFSVIIGLYFLSLLKTQQVNKSALEKESKKELEKLKKMKQKSLTMPLSEKTRPSSIDEIIGQEQGLKALRAALCGPNPQHVIIYGPPGVGKPRPQGSYFDEAKKLSITPFAEKLGICGSRRNGIKIR